MTPRIRPVFAVLLIFLAAHQCGFAQDEAPPQDKNQPQISELLKRLEQIEQELIRLKAKTGQLPADQPGQKVLALLESPTIGVVYDGSPDGTRYFAAKLVFINLTAADVEIRGDETVLDADGQPLKIAQLTPQLQRNSIQIGNQHVQFRSLTTVKRLPLRPGATGSTWVLFTGLPAGGDVPDLVLHFNYGETTADLNVNEFALGTLGLSVERIGPRGGLALLTISRSLDSVSAGSLVRTMDELASQNVARAVIQWTDSAAPLDSNLAQWLQQAAIQAGREEANNPQFPSIPASIRELHLAALPGDTDRSYAEQFAGGNGVPVRIHKTAAEAVAAALESAYAALPLDEVLQEIEHGHPLTRSAALASGGGRLPSEQLPLVLKYADDSDPAMQGAALRALRHFGETEAVDKLLHYARKGTEPLATTAIESLAGSRFATAHEALLALLQNEPPASKRAMVQILGQFPRPIWSDTIYKFVTEGDSEVAAAALGTLVRIGHPKLMEVLAQSLANGDEKVRGEAFRLLVARTDRESETLAMDYALKALADAPPTDKMFELLERTRDARAVPLLLKHFSKSGQDRQRLIRTLSQIGDEQVAEFLEKEYATLQGHERPVVLEALQQLSPPRFLKLAESALYAGDGSLVSIACRGLQANGSPEAVALLVAAMDKSTDATTWSYVANTLSTLATPEARAALRRARDATDKNKRAFALNALRNLQQQSPGYRHVFSGMEFARQEEWENAVKEFTTAIELDAELPDAYSQRANAYLKQNKNELAKADYTRALELDPYDSTAVTGLSIVMVIEGQYAEGIQLAEKSREKFSNDMLFAYNIACVYSRAAARAAKDAPEDQREQQKTEYEAKALTELKRSIKLGFGDFDWMKKDPDFENLHGSAEFQKITQSPPPSTEGAPNGAPDEAPEGF